MPSLVHQRCFNHAVREAVARCPECGRCFCRECITEHEDRVVCAVCLKQLARQPSVRRIAFTRIRRVLQCALSLLIAWFFFFLVAETLLRLPAEFHGTTLWQSNEANE